MLKKLVVLCSTFMAATPLFANQAHLTHTEEAQTSPVSVIKEVDLMLDWVLNPNHAAIVVAHQKGYFLEQNLKINLHEPSDPSMPAKLVAAGRYDLAVTYGLSFLIDLAESLPIQKVSTLVSTPMGCLMTLKSSGITELSQLDGKRVGYSIPHEVEKLEAVLQYQQPKPIHTDKVQVGWQVSQSLLAKQVDAVTGGYRTFEKHQVRLHGEDVNLFYPEEYGVPTHDSLVIVANQKHTDSATFHRFNRALEKAVVYITNHPKQAWEDFKAYNPGKLDNLLYQQAWFDVIRYIDHRPGAFDKQRQINYSKYLKSKHAMDRIPDFSNAFLD